MDELSISHLKVKNNHSLGANETVYFIGYNIQGEKQETKTIKLMKDKNSLNNSLRFSISSILEFRNSTLSSLTIDDMLDSFPVDKSSIINNFSTFRSKRFFTRFDPINPAPPVTITFFILLNVCVVFYLILK